MSTERERNYEQASDLRIADFDVSVRFGTHFMVPEDIRGEKVIVGEATTIPGLYAPFVQHEDIIKDRMVVEEKDEEKNEQAKKPLLNFTPIGVGGKMTEKDKEEVIRKNEEQKPVIIDTDRLGRSKSSDRQNDVVNKTTIAQIVLSYGLARVATKIGFENLKKLVLSDDGFEKVNEKAEGGVTRRDFLKLAGAFAAKEAIYAGTSGLVVAGVNKAMLDTPILGRRAVPPEIAGFANEVIFQFPADVLKLIGDKKDFHLFYSNINGRNINMALNTLHALHAVSGSDYSAENYEADALFGLGHVGIRRFLQEGPKDVEDQTRDYCRSLIADYSEMVTSESNSLVRRELMEDFVLNARTFSQPVSKKSVNVNRDVALPLTGSSLFWAEMHNHSQEIDSEEERQTMDTMVEVMGSIYDEVVERYAMWSEDEYLGRGRARHTGLWNVDLKEPATIYLPNKIFRKDLEETYKPTAIVVQNNTVVALPMLWGENGWQVIDSDSPLQTPVLGVNQGRHVNTNTNYSNGMTIEFL